MKYLNNGESVPARMFYYLLDWNEKNCWEELIKISGQRQLHGVSALQFSQLFIIATEQDAQLLIKSIMLSNNAPKKN